MDGFDTIAKYAVATVTGKDMDPINTNLTITRNSITGTIKNIPVGKDRFFEVTVYNGNKVPIYYGSAYADVQLSQITYVTITLQKLSGGTAVINGTIEENSSPCKEIYMANINITTMYLDKINKILEVGLSTSAKTANGDPIEFSWIIYGIDEKITQIDWSKDANNVKLPFPMNGKVQVIAYARCAIHTKIMTSDTLDLLIRDGNIIDMTAPESFIEFGILNIASSTVIPEKKLVETSFITAAKASDGAPLEYKWEIYYDGGSKIVDWSTNATTSTLLTPWTCNVKATVYARNSKYPEIMATAGFGMTLNEGKVIDFYSSVNVNQKPLNVVK
jgi:riboflavin synthase